jgi:hypothetical protein
VEQHRTLTIPIRISKHKAVRIDVGDLNKTQCTLRMLFKMGSKLIVNAVGLVWLVEAGERAESPYC